MIDELFKAMSNDNRITIHDDYTITARLNGLKLKVNGVDMYDWSVRNGYAITGKEIAFMDGNSMSYTYENKRDMDIDEYLGQIDHIDINEFLQWNK